MRRSMTTVTAALFCAASMAAVAAPANAAAIRPAGIVTSLWGYFGDLGSCWHEGAILGGANLDWIGYYCQVDPSRPATNVGLWYEVAN